MNKKKPKHFIGLGDAGHFSIDSIYHNEILSNAYFTCITDEEPKNNPSKIICIESSESSIIKSLKSKIPKRRVNGSEAFLFQQKIKEIFFPDHQYILIAGLGGKTGSFWMEYLTDYLIKTDTDFLSICSIPFSFEGKKRQIIAQRIINKYKNNPQFKYFSLDMILEKYGNMSIKNAFAKISSLYYKKASNKNTKW